MKDLTSLPSSVRFYLTKADDYLAKDQKIEASIMLAEAFKTLAHSNPEYCALLLGAQLGFRELTGTQRTKTTNTTVVDKKAFGVRYGKDVTTETTEHVVTRTIKLT